MSAAASLPLRLALRDLRAGLSGFRIFIACIILGVTAIVGVGSTARSLVDSLSDQGRRILGGDASFTTVLREISADERAWLESQGKVSEIGRMRAMARKGSEAAALVELKAVGPSYPEIGTLALEPGASSVADILERKDGVFGLLADEALVFRLGLKPGDQLKIGDATFQWRGLIKSEPDSLSGGLILGSRVIVSTQALRASGLIQPGSLVRWTYRIILQGRDSGNAQPLASKSLLDDFIKQTAERFPQAGWRVATRETVSPGFAKNLERFTQFLTLVGLTALIIGGIGIAGAVRGFVNRKQKDFAILKALGAPGSYVVYAALIEVLIAAMIGIVIGTAIGVALPFAISAIFGATIPLPFSPGVYPRQIVLGLTYGLLATLLFSLGPLGYLHDTPVSTLVRDTFGANRKRLRQSYKIALGALALLFLLTILLTATDRRSAAIFLAAAALILMALQVVGIVISTIVKRLPRRGSIEWRLAISNLGRPGALTRPVVTSVGLGLSLFVTLTMIDVNIREPLRRGIPGQTPSFFFMDIQSAQAESFKAFVAKELPEASIDMVPMLRGRLVKVGDTDAAKVMAKENVSWVLEGDRGITFATEVPEGSKVTEGSWWAKDYSGPPLVSVEAEVARGLGLDLGDSVTLNVLGRNITAKIANLREVNWRSYGINFVFVFTPNTFAGAPHALLATATLKADMSGSREGKLVTELASAYPNISTIRLKETLEAVAAIARQLGIAIRSATLVALLASVLVLAGTLAAGQSARIYDSVVLKVVGATRLKLTGAYMLEFVILGLATALVSLGAGTITAKLILTRVLNIDSFEWDWGGAAETLLLSLALIILIGIAGTWRTLKLPASGILRG